jgi:hypothetical protein
MTASTTVTTLHHLEKSERFFLHEWLKNPQREYIGPAKIGWYGGKQWPPTASIWFTPFKAERDGTPEVLVREYEALIRDRIRLDPLLLVHLYGLRGKVLGCYCAEGCTEETCYGMALVRIIEEGIRENIQQKRGKGETLAFPPI